MERGKEKDNAEARSSQKHAEEERSFECEPHPSKLKASRLRLFAPFETQGKQDDNGEEG